MPKGVPFCTGFKDEQGVDLGRQLIDKEYLCEAFPNIYPERDTFGCIYHFGCKPWIGNNGFFGSIGPFNSEFLTQSGSYLTTGANWTKVSMGNKHGAGIKNDGTLWIWGVGAYGRLGNNSTTSQSSPVQTVSQGTDWKQVSLGSCHSASIKTDGTLWLWGAGSYGRLGNNSTTDRSSPVQTVSTGTNWKDVSIANVHSVSVKTDGTLWSWGKTQPGKSTYGNLLGVGSTVTNRSSPVQTSTTGNNWRQASAGQFHTSAIKSDGTLWIWGGAPFIFENSTPVQVEPSPTNNWRQTASGTSMFAAIKNDGTLWTWGNSYGGYSFGQEGRTESKSVPAQTTFYTSNWCKVALTHTAITPNYVNYLGNGTAAAMAAAIKTDGTLWIWGKGTNILENSPTQVALNSNKWKDVSVGGYVQNDSGSNLVPGGLAILDACPFLCSERTGFYFNAPGINIVSDMGLNRCFPVQTFICGNSWLSEDAGCSNFSTISGGRAHSAAIKTDGTLWLWGSNEVGQLGNNGLISCCLFSPVQTVSQGNNWKQVSIGGNEAFFTQAGVSAGIKTDGTLWLWGENDQGRLGNNSSDNINQSSPVQTVSQGNNWKQVSISVNGAHSAAVKTNGTLWTWGCAVSGQLGDNSTIDKSSPVQLVSGGTTWNWVATGLCHSAGIKTDGTLWLWGNGDNGKLGNNSTLPRSSPVQTVSQVTTWKQVALGVGHSAAIKTDGTLWLWGTGSSGQLGNNATTNRSSPVQAVSTGTNWKQVSLGDIHSGAVKTDGTLWMWGENDCGRLGIGPTTNVNRSSPVQTVCGGSNWSQVGLGLGHSIATKSDGTLWVWGWNNKFQVREIFQNYYTGQCTCEFDAFFVRKDEFIQGGLWLWGQGGTGRLGNNATTDRSSPVQTISTGINWKQVSSGLLHSASIKTDGTLWLWGQGLCGRLGNNSTLDRSSPVQTVSTGANWKQVSITRHSAAIKTDGTLWLWGQGQCGILGTNSTLDRSSPVQTVSTGANWKQVSLGFCHSAAIKTDGTLWLWGYALNGRLGNDSTITQSSPVQTVSFGTDWKQVSLGRNHSSAIKTDGTLWLWGVNQSAQLGNNSTTSQSSPVQTVSTGTNWKQVSLGDAHSAAIKTDGTLWLWGINQSAQLGNNSTIDQSSPVQTVSTGTNWKQINLGCAHSASIKTDGTLWLWGCNDYGRLGNNSTINLSSPVQTVSTGTDWKQVSLGYRHSAAIREYCW